ncbi:phage tail tip lysozyme [Paraburkholderia nodosa]|uniref:phage tail tip lysozyme n=1 Tax=Paraburkholderia nodosa TaxID=392320 RepID=UPI0004B70603|nr:phage tail tip lysozyme [Paraburkholderia nodosa]
MANVFSITITAVDRATAVAQNVNKAVAKITKPISDVKASVSAFSKETGMDKLGRSIEKVGIFATESARRVASLAPPVAALTGAATVAGVVALATSWGRNAVQIRNTAYSIGMGTTELQEYQGAARLAGVSSESMTNGLKSVGSAFEDAAAGRDTFVAGVLADKGIGIHRLRDGSIDTAKALRDVANAASKISNTQARQKFLEIFGVSDLAPLLGKGSAAIDAYVGKFRSLNAVMTPEQIAQGERYNEALVGLDANVDKLKNSIGASLAPALAKVADEMGPIANEYGPKIARWIEETDWSAKADEIKGFVDSLGGVQTIAAAIAAITFAGPILSITTLIAKAVRLVGLLTTIATTTGPGGAAVVAAAGYIAEKERAKALDRSIHQLPGESAAGRDQRVAEAIAGGVATPNVAAPADGGLGGRIFRSIRSLFVNSAADSSQTGAIVQRFEDMGWSQAQASGIAANLYRESGYNAGAVGDNGTAYGLGQWHQDRQDAFRKRFGIDIRNSTLDQQLQFVDYEMRQGSEKRAGDALAQAQTAAQAGDVVSRLYERPADVDGEASSRAADAVAVNQSVAQSRDSTVHVKVELPNAPPGTRATVRTTGNTTASTNVGDSALMEPAI